MRVHGRNHIYETLPPFLGNRKLPEAERMVIGLTVATAPEQDAFQRDRERIFATFALDKAQEEADKRLRDLVRGKFAFCRGLVIEGINDDGRDLAFDEFYENGPPEIVVWVCKAVMSSSALSEAERKNFSPGSATPCALAQTPGPGLIAEAAENASATNATATTATG